MGYDAVVFDNDGVLLDLDLSTEVDVFRRMVVSTFEEFDVSPTETELAAFLGYGHPDIDKMRGVCAKYDLELEEVWRTRERRSAEIQRDLIREGKRSLYDDFDAVRDMKDRKLGIVSNNQHETVGYVTDHFGIDSLFGTYYGREPTVEGIRRSKPNSYYLERCLDDLGTRNAVFVGDNETDVVAAKRAGIDSVYVRRSHTVDIDEEPEYEVESLRELPEIV